MGDAGIGRATVDPMATEVQQELAEPVEQLFDPDVRCLPPFVEEA